MPQLLVLNVMYEIQWYLVTWTSCYKREMLVPTCSTWCSRCQATHCQQPCHHIKKYCLIRLRNLRRFWHLILWTLNWSHSSGTFCFWLLCRFKTKTWGQACGWQQTCDARYVARISHAKQIPRAKLFVSSFMDDQWRTSFYRSQNPAQAWGVRGSHQGMCCRMSEWMLWIFWSVLRSQIRNC